jgi:hypothetical protein
MALNTALKTIRKYSWLDPLRLTTGCEGGGGRYSRLPSTWIQELDDERQLPRQCYFLSLERLSLRSWILATESQA